LRSTICSIANRATLIRARVSDGEIPRECTALSITARPQDIHLFDKITRRRLG
jgi:multiple sugar transport system ATP-binding protein/inositol-phosphate transport system ATP-binding protein